MKQYGWVRPPLIVGFALSSITEWNFVISITLMGISWLWRPMVLGMIFIFVLNQEWTSLKERQIAKDGAMIRLAPNPADVGEDEDKEGELLYDFLDSHILCCWHLCTYEMGL